MEAEEVAPPRVLVAQEEVVAVEVLVLSVSCLHQLPVQQKLSLLVLGGLTVQEGPLPKEPKVTLGAIVVSVHILQSMGVALGDLTVLMVVGAVEVLDKLERQLQLAVEATEADLVDL